MHVGGLLMDSLRRDLPQLRADRGLSQRGLAAATGASQSTISRFEAGGTMPAEDALNLLAFFGRLTITAASAQLPESP